MGERINGFVPFGEYKPDLRYLANDGLLRAENVVPVYGDYLSSPAMERLSASIAAALPYGMYVDRSSGKGFVGLGDRLYEVLEDGTITDRSRAAFYGGLTGQNGFWRGCNFGTNVIMTDYTEPVQYLTPTAVDFADMITSTFAPRARFCFPLRNNLFLANCILPAAYDGLAIGANPVLVAWSASDLFRQFGSFNVDPQLVGAGYQELNFDIGNITGACAGSDGNTDYGIVMHSDGLVRVDGPPYSFRVIGRNVGGLYPYGICAAGQDVYIWTAAGLARLPGGSGPLEVIGAGKFVRAQTDNSTGFSQHPGATVGLADSTEAAYVVSIAHDPLNNILFVSYSENNNLYSKALLAYNIGEDRLSWFQIRHQAGADPNLALFLNSGRHSAANSWCPGRDVRFLTATSLSTDNYYTRFKLGNSFGDQLLQKGYIQLNAKQSTRFLRIRPVYAVTDSAAAEQVSLTIESTNKPYATPVTKGPYTGLDAHGWITTPDTDFFDFHAPVFTIAANTNMHRVVEYQGFEYEAELGPIYAA